MDILSKYAPKEIFIDPAEIFVGYIKNDLIKKGLLSAKSEGVEDFYVSANPESFVKNSELFYEVKTLPSVI